MISVQRLFEYARLPSEESSEMNDDNYEQFMDHDNERRSASKGNIEFERVGLTYKPGLPLALKDLTF